MSHRMKPHLSRRCSRVMAAACMHDAHQQREGGNEEGGQREHARTHGVSGNEVAALVVAPPRAVSLTPGTGHASPRTNLLEDRGHFLPWPFLELSRINRRCESGLEEHDCQNPPTLRNWRLLTSFRCDGSVPAASNMRTRSNGAPQAAQCSAFLLYCGREVSLRRMDV